MFKKILIFVMLLDTLQKFQLNKFSCKYNIANILEKKLFSGFVYIYEVTGTNGLLSLDLRSHKVKQKFSNEAITCIEVMEMLDYPCLLLCTGQILMIVEFLKI